MQDSPQLSTTAPTLQSPLSESASIVVVGLRNAGKSSLINTLFEKDVSIVSPVPGTTTDPVSRKMELPGWGPVAFVDTAGIDDEGDLGRKRLEKTESRLAVAAAYIFVTAGNRPPEPAEEALLNRLHGGGKPLVLAITHADIPINTHKQDWLNSLSTRGIRHVLVDNSTRRGGADLRRSLSALAQQAVFEGGPLDGLVSEGDHLLLVVPIDLAAPKGRLIQPQVETIRNALDKDCRLTIVKERELYETYRSFRERPKLVITDSQVFSKVAADIDPDQRLTSFSILFARKKGELAALVRGLQSLTRFKAGGRVFVMEACSHHRGADDIASVKIPRLFGRLVTPHAHFQTVRQLPEDITPEDLVIHCAGCMMTGAAMQHRLKSLEAKGIPVTNYGLFLAWANGLLPRAIEMLPEFPALWEGVL
ncbi:[FeFe] hydrogenase H-cluster maturation GTPase HydF [Gracilinema caldarium]|uniref:Small GTP-binding protein n=1 Tax=Gracilinema caldarium (strain ATCC 51460 / DSM 7334 / H1) TaxID=744872 RepID=F8F3Y8_GRAC1|nr:[FeFe] hydrogenase H-cluster maturation GTPase HydF [Gracilinema caldarium]AEJ20007.1 small GTP-binding protein [Gracilinema caldarium DSM 7334]